jgi:hypothetical protein
VVFVVTMAAFGVRVRREVRAVRVAPLESSGARPAVLSAMERHAAD